MVREVAAPDVGRMGIEILSFTIKDVYDDVQYLQSLGKAQTANVKRDADAGVAEANRYELHDLFCYYYCYNQLKFLYVLIETEMQEYEKLNARRALWMLNIQQILK